MSLTAQAYNLGEVGEALALHNLGNPDNKWTHFSRFNSGHPLLSLKIRKREMAKLKEEVQEKGQLQLVTMTPAQKRTEVTNLIASIELKEFERQKHLGNAKTCMNEIKEMLTQAKKLSREASTGQVRLEIDRLLAELGNDDDNDVLDGRVLDQSKIKTAEELRRHPNSEASVTEGGEEAPEEDEE